MFEKNLEALLNVNPQLAAKILSIKTNDKFEVFMDEKDPINVNLYDKENDFIFYPSKPIDEVISQYNDMLKKYARYPFMFFYGISNGLLIKLVLT